jgi:hypothetical protein
MEIEVVKVRMSFDLAFAMSIIPEIKFIRQMNVAVLVPVPARNVKSPHKAETG